MFVMYSILSSIAASEGRYLPYLALGIVPALNVCKLLLCENGFQSTEGSTSQGHTKITHKLFKRGLFLPTSIPKNEGIGRWVQQDTDFQKKKMEEQFARLRQRSESARRREQLLATYRDRSVHHPIDHDSNSSADTASHWLKWLDDDSPGEAPPCSSQDALRMPFVAPQRQAFPKRTHFTDSSLFVQPATIAVLATPSVTYSDETLLYDADPLMLSLRHICDEGYHVWGRLHPLKNYLNVSACSSSCLQAISRHAPDILAAYTGRRLHAIAIQRFIQMNSCRRNSILRIRQGSSVTTLHGRLYLMNSDMTDGASSSTTG
jgi:hypothetical protein